MPAVIRGFQMLGHGAEVEMIERKPWSINCQHCRSEAGSITVTVLQISPLSNGKLPFDGAQHERRGRDFRMLAEIALEANLQPIDTCGNTRYKHRLAVMAAGY
jgi:hypothetical protein